VIDVFEVHSAAQPQPTRGTAIPAVRTSDPFRNAFGQTAVAPYSVRRREKAPISTPLERSKVKPTRVPSDFNMRNFQQRLQGPDPWKGFFRSRQLLKDAKGALRSL
jgi:bifunctional non-homologous end joining protein LigD